MAGPWLCSHLYEHYLSYGDTAFLRDTAYPVMGGAAEFCLAWLIHDGTGNLMTCPSESTENDFLAPDGKPADTSAGCTMDTALMRELFANCGATAKTLQMDADPLPMHCNVATRSPIDVLASDLYTPGYEIYTKMLDVYHRPDNAMLVPGI